MKKKSNFNFHTCAKSNCFKKSWKRKGRKPVQAAKGKGRKRVQAGKVEKKMLQLQTKALLAAALRKKEFIEYGDESDLSLDEEIIERDYVIVNVSRSQCCILSLA